MICCHFYLRTKHIHNVMLLELGILFYYEIMGVGQN